MVSLSICIVRKARGRLFGISSRHKAGLGSLPLLVLFPGEAISGNHNGFQECRYRLWREGGKIGLELERSHRVYGGIGLLIIDHFMNLQGSVLHIVASPEHFAE